MNDEILLHEVDATLRVALEPTVNQHGVLKVSSDTVHLLTEDMADAVLATILHHLFEGCPLHTAAGRFRNHKLLNDVL